MAVSADASDRQVLSSAVELLPSVGELPSSRYICPALELSYRVSLIQQRLSSFAGRIGLVLLFLLAVNLGSGLLAVEFRYPSL